MKVLLFSPSLSENIHNKDIEIINIPLFEIKCISYKKDFDDYEAIAFTSKNAVKCFDDWDKVKNKKIFAIGKPTSELIREKGFNSIYPSEYDSIHLSNLILESGIKSLVAFRSSKASADMKSILSNKIAYMEIYDYKTTIIKENVKKAKEELKKCNVNIVALTSSEIARTIASFLNNCYKIISIGPMTTKTISLLRPDLKIIESNEHDFEGIIRKVLGE
ncbi:uroporphyrinogen-III synthase [Acidianus brierleyi]|uniref:Uroporphyrinogen-III synthase n=1 Tax=Acidianus brierleyi TaxID=41673 RepID=A0A2U9IEE1_9CREN|nr:uroporphyrinogen-III synthase [Acidianus brierleyi]AWR94336.1 uroporphyrinogen-III synthase [Acidianus brierleyi]